MHADEITMSLLPPAKRRALLSLGIFSPIVEHTGALLVGWDMPISCLIRVKHSIATHQNTRIYAQLTTATRDAQARTIMASHRVV